MRKKWRENRALGRGDQDGRETIDSRTLSSHQSEKILQILGSKDRVN
jgi:hypothetical protein